MQTSREVYSHSDWQIRARLYEYWPSGTVAVRTEQKPGCLRELGRQEASQCLALKEKMCFINWLTFQTIYLLTGCIVFAKASWKDMQLFKWWFNLQYAADSNSLLGISHELDNMFPSIKVPHDFTRKPCSIAEFNTEKHQNFICLPSLMENRFCYM